MTRGVEMMKILSFVEDMMFTCCCFKQNNIFIVGLFLANF
jgi:hypothetical protein